MQGMDPEIQAFFEKMFAGNSGPAPAGPPGMEGLEGGWSHIPQDPMAFIMELLTPQNVQRTTQFAGGSHYGPDRNKSIPAQNFAQAEALLNMMMKKDAHERNNEITGLADQTMRSRLEAERTNLSPGSITMNGETMEVPGKMGVQTDITPAEAAITGAGGYEDTRYPPRGYGTGGGGGGQTGPDYGDVTDRAEFLQKTIAADRAALAGLDPEGQDYMDLQARIGQTQTALDALLSGTGGSGGGQEPGLTAATGEYVGEGERPRTLEENIGYRPAWMDEQQQGDSSAVAQGGGPATTGSPVGAPSGGMTPGEKYMASTTASQGPITDTNPGRVDEQYKVGNFLESVWDSLRPPDKEKIFRQGYDPETGEFIMPDNPLWARVSPEAQKRILSRLDAGNDTRQASLGALGYPAYEPEG